MPSSTPARFRPIFLTRSNGSASFIICASTFRVRHARCRFSGVPFDHHLEERKETNMRVLVIVKASKESEAGQMPSEQILREMGNFNEQLVKAGVMQAGEGLHPSSKGKRVRFSGTQRTVIDGPFAETKELIAGFWIWKVKSMDDAVEWLKKAPFGGG